MVRVSVEQIFGIENGHLLVAVRVINGDVRLGDIFKVEDGRDNNLHTVRGINCYNRDMDELSEGHTGGLAFETARFNYQLPILLIKTDSSA